MVKNPELLERAELEYQRQHPLTLEEKYKLLEDMYQFALSMGRLGEKKYNDESDHTVRFVEFLHGNIPKTSGSNCTSA